MLFKKCDRCGSFYSSEHNLCNNCKNKDILDTAKVKDFLDSSNTISSLGQISHSTGVSIDCLERIRQQEDLTEAFSKL